MKDKLNRRLTDLRISVTDRCNFRCRYCMPEELYGEAYEFLKKDQVLSFEEIVRLTKIFIKLGVNKVRLTGGEPLVRKNIESLISSISSLSKNIDLAMTTNGYLLNKFANILFVSGLKRLTISLDSLDNDIFQKMSGKKFNVDEVLMGISTAKKVGFEKIKINSVIKKGINDEGIIDLVDYCKREGHILRFIEYMDVGTLNSWNRKSVVDSKKIIDMISKKYPIHPISKNYSSEVADRYKFDDGDGELGFISSVSNPFCMSCTRSRLTADGKFVTCLFSNKGLDLKRHLRSRATDEDILNLISENWLIRDDQYSLDRSLEKGKVKDKIEMFQLGG
ncbi:MAG: GTP 3',8-cyclase MoaA [Chloroflexi bacterium]|nr:GTP 3',8-cyclase MoaA [Chloroflexota bacterium]|tara:strand:- start:3204 stop:4208 length:1005 start_codon:yes stop_codon:yes gene_type:complete